MNQMETRVIAWAVTKKGAPIFDELTTTVRIEDEAAGEFVVLEQFPDEQPAGKISISPAEWPLIRRAINHAVRQCKEAKP